MNHWLRNRLKRRSNEVRSFINSIAPVSYRVNLITRTSYSIVFECNETTISISGTKTETYIRINAMNFKILPDYGTDDFWIHIKSYLTFYFVPYLDGSDE